MIDLDAELFTKLPPAHHYRGEPTDWVRVTRPGQRLHSFLEGPCFDSNGDLWVADVPYGRLFRISPNGEWTLALSYDGEPHSIARMPDGAFAITDYRLGLLRFDPAESAPSVLCNRSNTEHFRGLSDLTVAKNGDIWFTDPGRSSLSDPTGRLFRLRSGAQKPELILDCVPYPNGVALSHDEKHVLLAATRANAVWRLLANAPDPTPPMAGVYAHLSGGLGPDGLAIDSAGNLFVAQAQAGRVYIFDSRGDLVARIRTQGGAWTTAVAISPDNNELFIVEAEQGAIHRVRLDFLSKGKD